MKSTFKHFSIGQAIRISISITAIALLWLVGFQVIFAVPRATQDFAHTTVDDFAPGSFVRTGIANNRGGEVQLLPIGVAGLWVTDTQQLPAPRAQLAVVSWGSRIYAFGGIDNTFLPLPEVYSTTVVSNNLTPWVTQTISMPVGLAGHVGLIATVSGVTRIYAIGGYDQFGIYSSKTYYAPLNSDGSVGAWITSTVNLPAGLAFASGVVNKGRIYLIGGIRNDATYRIEVYYAPINADGSLGAWVAASPLPQGLALTAAVVYNGSVNDTIYVMGGATSTTANTAAVYFADVLGDGSLTAWTASARILPEAFSSHAALQANGQIYVIGGNSGGQTSNQVPRKVVLTALIDETNPTRLFDLGGFSWVATESLYTPRRYHGVAIVDGEIFTVGGDDIELSAGFNATRITYHGPTRGPGAFYAPNGNYLSPAINVGTPLPLSEFAWSAVRTNTAALDLTMRYRTSNDGVNWSAWSGLLPSNPQPSGSIDDAKPITYPLNITAQYFQYQAFFTTTNNTLTPYLMESHLRIIVPSSDLAVSKKGQAATVLPGNLVTYTINYTNFVGSAVPNVILTETVPANTTYVDAGVGWTQVGASNTYVKSVGSLGIGSSGSTIFVIRINPAFPPGIPAVYNTVKLGGDPDETNLTNNSYTETTAVEALKPGVDLRVIKDDSFLNPRAGQILTYTITFSNFGDTPANDVVLTEVLPAGMTFVGTGWTPIGGNSFTRAIGAVASAGAGSVTFSAQVDPNAIGGTLLTNTVSIGFPGVDVMPSNNIATDVDYVTLPNLKFFKFDDAAILAPGQTTVYNFSVLNVGGSVASNVVITETPPLTLVQVVSAPGWTQVGAVWVKSFGNLAPGVPLNDTFAVRVLNSTPNGSVITNTARVNAANQDPVQTSGLVSTDVNIVAIGAPDLQILNANPTGVAEVGITTTFTVRVTNAGNTDAATWSYTDMYVNRVPANRSDLGDTYADSGGSIAPGENRTLSYTWIFAQPGTYQLYFQIDTCDTSSIGFPSGLCYEPSYGRVPEANESNNIFGPVSLYVFSAGTVKSVYLPFISR